MQVQNMSENIVCFSVLTKYIKNGVFYPLLLETKHQVSEETKTRQPEK